jgi:heptosyltransferase-2
VHGTSWVGDTVISLPALKHLRRIFPHAHLAYVARPWTAGLFAESDLIDELLIYQRRSFLSPLRQAKRLRQATFDLAVLFQNAFEAALIAALARIPTRIGYATDRRALLLTHPVRLPTWRAERHEVFYYLNLATETERLLCARQSSLLSDGAALAPCLEVSPQRQARIRALLRERGMSISGPLIALCPGSTNSEAKRWPADRFAALGDRLIDELNAEIVLIGAPSEMEVAREVAAKMKHEPKILTGTLDIEQVTALLSIADLLVTNDTGPAHIGGALGKPTLVIFGPTDPTRTRPFSPTAEIVHHPPPCAPCHLRQCPIDHRCMTDITADEIFAKAFRILQRPLLESANGSQSKANIERNIHNDGPISNR